MVGHERVDSQVGYIEGQTNLDEHTIHALAMHIGVAYIHAIARTNIDDEELKSSRQAYSDEIILGLKRFVKSVLTDEECQSFPDW